MTMQVPSESNGVSTETTAPEALETTTVAVADDTPKTPGEAAKEARISAEIRARQARIKKKSDEVFQQRKAFEEEKRAWTEQQAADKNARDERVAKLEAELAEMKSGNPLLRKGVDATSVLREFVDQNTPEAKIIALQREIADQRAAFEKRWEEHGAAAKAREEEETKRRAEVIRESEAGVIRQFTLWVTHADQAKTFKHLNAEFSQDEIQSMAWRVSEAAKKIGKAYSGREVAEYLEKVAEEEYKSREERRQLYLGAIPATPPAEKASPALPPAKGNGSSSRKPFSAMRPASSEEEREADLAALRRATEKDRIARMGK